MGGWANGEARAHFDGLRALLDEVGIPYVINPKLVRGLDYYCHTAFEFVVRNEEHGEGGDSEKENGGKDTRLGLGVQQGTVLAGGRYDGLLGSLGYKHGDDIPGIGWAAGIDTPAGLTLNSTRTDVYSTV